MAGLSGTNEQHTFEWRKVAEGFLLQWSSSGCNDDNRDETMSPSLFVQQKPTAAPKTSGSKVFKCIFLSSLSYVGDDTAAPPAESEAESEAGSR